MPKHRQANVCGVNYKDNSQENPAAQRQLPRPGSLLGHKDTAQLGGCWFLTHTPAPGAYKTGRLNANDVLLLKKTQTTPK